MAGIPIPPFGKVTEADLRQWDGKVYKSPRSYASEKVIYSRHALTQELFVVFRKPDGVVRLRPGEKIREAKLADDWFQSTDKDIRSCLRVEGNKVQLKSNAMHLLGRGIRMVLIRP